MTEGVKTIIYPVKDLAKAKTLYSKLLGVEPFLGGLPRRLQR
jgi:extradiol dioxygenase family protein